MCRFELLEGAFLANYLGICVQVDCGSEKKHLQCIGRYKNTPAIYFGLEILVVQWCNYGQGCLHSRAILNAMLSECGFLASAMGTSACNTVYIIDDWNDMCWDHLPSALSIC